MNRTESPTIEVVSDAEAVARRAVDLFIRQAREAVTIRGRFTVAVSGGRTPRRFFELLAADPQGQALPWDRVQVCWTDERMVPPDDARSNYRLVREALLDRVALPAENLHPVDTRHPNAFAAAEAYEADLRLLFEGQNWPVFDWIVLGMGADGHTASLFPHTYAPFNDEDWACGVPEAPDGLQRVSLTAPVLRAARTVTVLLTGPDKAKRLAQVMAGPFDAMKTPIHVLEPIWSRVHWLVDEAAAAELG